MHTPEIAKDKICPVITKNIMVNDGAGIEWCVAENCMAWRFIGGRSEEGYCGLAGKP
jgi:hypothetical protein